MFKWFRNLFPPYPAEKGYMWRKINGQWREVCDTCGGNCGQCGDMRRLGNVPVDFDTLIDKSGMKKPRHPGL